MTSLFLLVPAAVLCHLWKWQVTFAPCCSSFSSFPLETTSKQKQQAGESTWGGEGQRSFESTSAVCVLPWLSQPLCCVLGREKTASECKHLHLAHFPKPCELGMECWCWGFDNTPAITVLCIREQPAMVSYSYVFPNLAFSA